MPHTIIFLAKARLELLKAWTWYEDRQVGLGDRFNNEVEKALQRIQLKKVVVS
jgi:hypothetical protein